MGYPWDMGAKLTFTDLNAAFALAYANAQAALLSAAGAQTTANNTAAALTIGKPVSVTLNWPALTAISGTYVLSATLPYALLVTSVDANIGTNQGVITAQYRANGVTIGNLTSLSVTQPVKTNFPAVAGPSNPLQVGAGSLLDVVINVISGAPIDSYLCLNGIRTS